MYKEEKKMTERIDFGGLVILAAMAIPELVFLILGWNFKGNFNPYPFWALTLYLVLLFLMMSASFVIFSEKAMKITWKNPFVYVVFAIVLIQVLLQYLVFKSMPNPNYSLSKAMRIMFVIPFFIYSGLRRNFPMFILSFILICIVMNF